MTMTQPVVDVLDLIDDSWETLVAAGLDAVQVKDGRSWELGDLAGRVAKRYGEDSLGQYATDIRYNTSTLRDFRRVAAFYPPDTRTMFPLLRWSHYRVAMRVQDLESALDWLEQAADHDWPVDALRDALSAAVGEPLKPLKVEGQGRVVRIEGRTLVLEVVGDWSAVESDAQGRVALYIEREIG
jgi:hypothetical protein